MEIRPELHHILLTNDKYELPSAPYTLSFKEKTWLLTILKHLRVLDGYASNISRCFNLNERKLFNLKTYDCHILMQDLLPITLRAAKYNDFVDIIWALSTFIKELCTEELTNKKLDEVAADVVVTLCRMEKLVPSSFFTIMVNLIVHLIEEAKLERPILYMWMYPIERLEFTLSVYA